MFRKFWVGGDEVAFSQLTPLRAEDLIAHFAPSVAILFLKPPDLGEHGWPAPR
jgi:hypothetical protein